MLRKAIGKTIGDAVLYPVAQPFEKEMYWLEETKHRFDGYNWFGDHPEKMLECFNKYL